MKIIEITVNLVKTDFFFLDGQSNGVFRIHISIFISNFVKVEVMCVFFLNQCVSLRFCSLCC